VLSLVAIVFSISLVVMQLANQQYSPGCSPYLSNRKPPSLP
jgi:uncharacterized membrane protein